MENYAKVQQIKKQKSRETLKKHIFCYTLLSVTVVHWVIFWLIVNVQSLILPFQDSATGAFTVSNFGFVFELLTAGRELVIAFKNTLLYYAQGLFTNFVVATFFAYFLYKKVFMHKLFSVVFMLPQIISSVIMVAIYKNIVGTGGPVDAFYGALTGQKMRPLLYTEGGVATWTIVVYCIWTGFGMNLILFSGAMAKIPPEIVESANLDGVSFIREFFSVELPLIWPTLSVMLLLAANGIFMASGPIILFTDGLYETQTISYWFYRKVILDNDYNLASAFGLLLTAAGAPLTLLVQFIRRKIPTDVSY